MSLEAIKPIIHQRIMDLIADAGIDISDWANFKGGKKRAASNPKYCYDWSFANDTGVVVLNLWFSAMETRESDGKVIHNLNARNFSIEMGRLNRPRLRNRATKMDTTLQRAFREKLSIRVIVLEGEMKDALELETESSEVKKRLLDPQSWYLESYDWTTGQCILVRGEKKIFIDQFDVQIPDENSNKHTATSTVYLRDPAIRSQALLRASGVCELCREEGFKTHDGRIYLESHHVIPLSEDGPDTVKNVVAICANCHKKAHLSSDRAIIKNQLINLLEKI